MRAILTSTPQNRRFRASYGPAPGPVSYERAYYAGIISERRAKAQLNQGFSGTKFDAYEWLCEAMIWYEKAEALRPPGNDDAILRWNFCARIIMDNNLVLRQKEDFKPALE